MGDSQVMTGSRVAEDEELMVSEVEVATLPKGSEPTTEPSEDDSSGSGGDGEEEAIKWQGDPSDPGTGSGTGGTGTGS